ncbi:GGDEF domain-containing protein [Silanimonas sp.]|jgi:diguanylate cyclase (GGDEF)-like protein|uniref:GGDEF domain-containing protein n=1 Tax=Silanimonas sp. TaxID=1929290 RepID=UPI0022C1737B|nr:GGDEF domain-containing protein [Silanimonas sp.]MCZ8064156.1 GGDEF domain-containing protein [Silanimonas sp.]
MTQFLDVRTLLVMVAVIATLSAIGMASFGRRYPRFSGVAWFAVADLFLAIGMLLVATRDYAPDWLTTVVANVFSLGGLLLNAEGLRRYAGGDWPWWSRPYFLFLLLLPVTAWFTYVDPDVRIRVLAFTGCVGFTLCAIAVALHRSPAGPRLRLVQLAFGGFALWMAGRWLFTLTNAPMPSFMDAGSVHAMTILGYVVFVMTKNYGILRDSVGQALGEIEAQAHTDALTGLLNRRGLAEFAAPAIARARRQGSPFSVALLDIDHFKRINDAHGHAAGDAVLVGIAGILRSRLRASDACARLGGEEFVLLLPDTNEAQALHVADVLRERVASVEFLGVGRCTVSFGVSTRRDDADLADMLRAADRAMYAAKAAGRNLVVQA